MILIRQDDDKPRVLMGQRSRGHDFMPDKFVFPGGRVDTEDGRAPALSELNSTCETALQKKNRRRPRAFALTAIRETFEETGLIVGKSANTTAVKPPTGWQDFYGSDVQPCLSGLTFVGRAVTPPYRPKRFDARFFMADASEALIDDRPPMDGAELINQKWFTLEEASELDLPSVTRFMLGEINQRLMKPDEQLAPFHLRWTVRGHTMDRL